MFKKLLKRGSRYLRVPKLLLIVVVPAVCFTFSTQSLANTIVRIESVLGNIDIELFDTVTPGTVANFLTYITDGDYNETFIHRSVAGFVIQGGGLSFDPATGTASHIDVDAPITNEFSLSNYRGTVAMAKVGGDPDSATSEWFINLADNTSNLDFTNGGFTVFGRVINNGMVAVDAIAGLPVINAGGAANTLPVIDYSGGAIGEEHLVNIRTVSVLPFKRDMVVDFGNIGLWARMNDASWEKLNNISPDKVVMGDMDGNGQGEVIADFSSTLGGIFVKQNSGGWAKLHNSTPDIMAVGDLDHNGKDDVVIDFGDILGLWARMNDEKWLKLHNSSPDQIVIGDIDGNGQDDVIAYFSSFSGIFVKRNLGAWTQMHNLAPESMVIGDLDKNNQDDIVIDFGSIGLWARMNDASWQKLHNNNPDLIATGDVDGEGADDVIATFGSTFGGLWQKVNLGGWIKLNANAPDQIIADDVNGGGQDDIIADFGSTIGGVYVKRDQGPWAKLHNTSPDNIVTGNIDGS